MRQLIPPQDFAFYADESGISQDRYTVVGGVCMRKSTAEAVYSSISTYRNRHGMHSELKWSKVSDQKIGEYEALLDLFFELNNSNLVQFHWIVFDNHQWNHKKYNSGDPDIGLSKLYYQLLLYKFVQICGRESFLFACLDHRHSSTGLEDLKKMINSAAARNFQMAHSPLAQLISRDSKLDPVLQLNDVILGAVNAHRNGKHLLAGGRASKRALAVKVQKMSGLRSFDMSSPRHIRRFTCWNFQPRPR